MKAGGEQLFVFTPELADGVVVGVGISGEVAHGNIFISKSLDPTAGEGSCGIAVNE